MTFGGNGANIPPAHGVMNTPSGPVQSLPQHALPFAPRALRALADNNLSGVDSRVCQTPSRPDNAVLPPKSNPSLLSGMETPSTSQLLSRIGSIATSQKRPLHTSDVPDGYASAKRHKFGETYPSPSSSSTLENSADPVAHAPSSDMLLLQGTISSLKIALKNERERHEADEALFKRAFAKLADDYRQVYEAEKTARDRNRELDQEVNGLKAAERELSRQLHDMQGAPEHEVSRKKELQNALYAAEEGRRMAEQRERKLQAALDEAESRIKGGQVHPDHDALEKAFEKASHAEEARVVAEEERKSAENKLLIAEKALSAERIKRIAAEETFLDVKNIFSLNVLSQPERSGSTPNDSG